jgi:hypothetical protein
MYLYILLLCEASRKRVSRRQEVCEREREKMEGGREEDRDRGVVGQRV